MSRTAFARWINTFISEKGLDREQIIEATSPNGTVNMIPLGMIIDRLKFASPVAEQAQAKQIIVQIDFRNGDVMHFFKHLAQGMAVDL